MLYGFVLQLVLLLIVMSYLAVNSMTSSDFIVKSLYLDGMLKQEKILSDVIINYKNENNKIPNSLKQLKDEHYIDSSFEIINPFSKIGKINDNFKIISKNEIGFISVFDEEPNSNLYSKYYKSKLNGYVPTCHQDKKNKKFICTHVYYIGN